MGNRVGRLINDTTRMIRCLDRNNNNQFIANIVNDESSSPLGRRAILPISNKHSYLLPYLFTILKLRCCFYTVYKINPMFNLCTYAIFYPITIVNRGRSKPNLQISDSCFPKLLWNDNEIYKLFNLAAIFKCNKKYTGGLILWAGLIHCLKLYICS